MHEKELLLCFVMAALEEAVSTGHPSLAAVARVTTCGCGGSCTEDSLVSHSPGGRELGCQLGRALVRRRPG